MITSLVEQCQQHRVGPEKYFKWSHSKITAMLNDMEQKKIGCYN